jgi:hypothetical protein
VGCWLKPGIPASSRSSRSERLCRSHWPEPPDTRELAERWTRTLRSRFISLVRSRSWTLLSLLREAAAPGPSIPYVTFCCCRSCCMGRSPTSREALEKAIVSAWPW